MYIYMCKIKDIANYCEDQQKSYTHIADNVNILTSIDEWVWSYR